MSIDELNHWLPDGLRTSDSTTKVITLIKVIRAATGWGLQESFEFVRDGVGITGVPIEVTEQQFDDIAYGAMDKAGVPHSQRLVPLQCVEVDF